MSTCRRRQPSPSWNRAAVLTLDPRSLVSPPLISPCCGQPCPGACSQSLAFLKLKGLITLGVNDVSLSLPNPVPVTGSTLSS